MPTKRKHGSQSLKTWFRSSRSRTGGRSNVSSFRLKRTKGRVGRRRRGARRRLNSFRKRSKGSSSFQKLTKILAPVSSYSYTVAGRAEVGYSAIDPACKWFLPERAANFSLGYPNLLDINNVAFFLNQQSRSSALETVPEMSSLDMKFLTSGFRQTTKVVNQCNAQAILEYHVIEARRDIPYRFNSTTGAYNILDLLGSGFFTAGVSSIPTNGIESIDPAATFNDLHSNQGMVENSRSIYTSGPFLHYFKVKKVKKVVLNAGDIKLFTLSHKGAITHRPALYARLTANASSWAYNSNEPFYAFLKGCQFQLFKLSGTPVNDKDTKTLVNLSGPAVDFVTDVRFSYQSVIKTGGVNWRGASYGLGVLPTPQFMGEQTDTALTVLNA